MVHSTLPIQYLASSTARGLGPCQAVSSDSMLRTDSVQVAEEVSSYPFCVLVCNITIDYCVDISGKLCGDCLPGYGTTFDLRYCFKNCRFVGIVLLVGICLTTFILSLAVLYYDFPLPNELKGVIFFAQVIPYSPVTHP